MKQKQLFTVSVVAAAVIAPFAVFAGATFDQTTNILTFDVASGEETYSTPISSGVAGIVKTGAGKMILTAASADFTSGKPITVSGGTLEIQHTDALGSGNTVTVANGATFAMIFAAVSYKGGEKNDIVLQQNATLRVGGAEFGDYFIGNVTLEGDATIDVQSRRGFGKTLDLNGYTLTRIGNNVEFVLAGSGTAGTTAIVKGPGTIRNSTAGMITLMGAPSFIGDGMIESAHSGTVMNLWNLTVPMPWGLSVEENVSFRIGSSIVGGVPSNPLANRWSGNVEIAADKKITFTKEPAGDYMSFEGVISGDGGIEVPNGLKGAIIQMKNANSYEGGTRILGSKIRAFTDGALPLIGEVFMQGGALDVVVDDGCYSKSGIEALAAHITYTWVSGSTPFSLYASAGTTATVDASLSRLNSSILIFHDSPGDVIFNGGVPSGAMINNYDGHFTLGGANKRNMWSFTFRAGTTDVTGGNLNRNGDNSTKTYRVGSSNDYENAKLRMMGGHLYFPASNVGRSHAIQVMDSGIKPAILEVYDGGAVTAKVNVAQNKGTSGAVYQYGGAVRHLSQSNNDGYIGGAGTAFYGMYGGAFSGIAWLSVAQDKDGVGLFEMQDGSLSFTSEPFVISRSASHGEFYMGGGTANIPRLVMGGLDQSQDGVSEGGTAVFTMSGTNNPSLTVRALQMCERTNGFTSVVNLNAGTLMVTDQLREPAWESENRVNCKSYVNFNGGALKFSGNNVLPNEAGAPTRVTVFKKGATLMPTGSLNFYGVLETPYGRGVESIRIPDGVSIEGYSMPPTVTIVGGGGEGATAHVKFDPRTGRIDREIEVTCPGCGFITEPTVSITAPDMKTLVTCDVSLTEGEQESGGLTVNCTTSSGRLNLYSVCTYTGATVVVQGYLYPFVKDAIASSCELRMAGGRFSGYNLNPSYRRLGGFGTTESWENANITVTDAFFFRAQDLEQGLCLRHGCGRLILAKTCVVEIDDFNSLTKDSYTLVYMDGTLTPAKNILDGTPKFAADVAAANPRWRLSLSANKKLLKLRRVKGTAVSVR